MSPQSCESTAFVQGLNECPLAYNKGSCSVPTISTGSIVPPKVGDQGPPVYGATVPGQSLLILHVSMHALVCVFNIKVALSTIIIIINSNYYLIMLSICLFWHNF